MSAVETRAEPSALSVPAGEERPPRRPRRLPRPTPWWAAVAGVLLLAFVLRLWGVKHGLPYAYNADENAHYVPRAIGLFGHDWDPGYFVNPPAFTYVLHIVFGLWYGGRVGVSDAFAANPTPVWALARFCAAALGTLSVGLLYLFGARLIDRR